jgi:16S rRNA (cytosine967-C5)-methyltransferase
MRVADTCAGPGGKATAIAATGAYVVATDVQVARARLILVNARRLDADVAVMASDGRAPALRRGSFPRVLVDAPCSGLGVLRRRPDARWRVDAAEVERLAALQRDLVEAAIDLVSPGGDLVYSVCTMTAAETVGIDEWLADAHPELTPLPMPEGAWRAHGRGAILLPQAAGTDGMFLLRVHRGGEA